MTVALSGKRRMLNAYQGIFSDRYPVAPEFWYYYPAKVLGVDMIQFQREVLHWSALKTTFERFGTDGWGVVGCDADLPDPPEASEEFVKIGDGRYELRSRMRFKGACFQTRQYFDRYEPAWIVEFPVKEPGPNLDAYVDMATQPWLALKPEPAIHAYESVGESYLLEGVTPGPFTDLLASGLGFEKAAEYLMTEELSVIERYHRKYLEFATETTARLASGLPFESYFMGCSFSCASLIGARLWRQWDMPVMEAVAKTLHKHGKLLHVHYHGRSMDNAADLARTGADCVCPFERPPGGDVDGLEGLKRIREMIGDRLTFNGNVHTVETLIRGRPEDVRREVREILEAFAGSPRLIVGTGDQVGRETPEENLHAMVEEVVSARVSAG